MRGFMRSPCAAPRAHAFIFPSLSSNLLVSTCALERRAGVYQLLSTQGRRVLSCRTTDGRANGVRPGACPRDLHNNEGVRQWHCFLVLLTPCSGCRRRWTLSAPATGLTLVPAQPAATHPVMCSAAAMTTSSSQKCLA